MAVKALQPAPGELFVAGNKAVGADDLQLRVVPQDQVIIVVVVIIQIAAAAAALAHCAKGDLPQPSQLAQQRHPGGAVAPPQVDLLAVAGGAEMLALAQRALQLAAIFGAGDRFFSLEQAGTLLADAIKVFAQPLRQRFARRMAVMPVRKGDLRADMQLDARAALAEHLAHQHQQRQRLGDFSRRVEQAAVAPVDENRHQRRTGARRQTQKGVMPAAVAHAATAEARYFTRRENNQHPVVAKVLLHTLKLVAAGAVAHVVYRQQQRTERLQHHQHAVGDDFHIAPHLRHRRQQRQSVERPQRMVGDDHHRSARRDLLQIALAQLAAHVEVLQHLLDHIQPFQMRIARGEALKLLFMQRPAQHPTLPACGLSLRPEAFDNLIDREHNAPYFRR